MIIQKVYMNYETFKAQYGSFRNLREVLRELNSNPFKFLKDRDMATYANDVIKNGLITKCVVWISRPINYKDLGQVTYTLSNSKLELYRNEKSIGGYTLRINGCSSGGLSFNLGRTIIVHV